MKSVMNEEQKINDVGHFFHLFACYKPMAYVFTVCVKFFLSIFVVVDVVATLNHVL